jgi:1,3-beta-glucanosyltransferase GAS5
MESQGSNVERLRDSSIVRFFSQFGDNLINNSFSEYGCKENGRTFEEVASLYSTQMSAVFSGGLAYEYSLEDNGFGVVKIQPDGSVKELEGFPLLAKQLKSNPDPPGDGGYKAQGSTSDCPKQAKFWLPQNSSLPLVPGTAASFFKKGAGAPRGLDGTPKCSHWCGARSAGLESKDGSKSGDGKAGKSEGSFLQLTSVMRAMTVIAALALL